MGYDYTQFRNTVTTDFFQRQNGMVVEASASADTRIRKGGTSLGHPLFESLGVGDRKVAPIAAVFLDLTNFTGRTFWDEADQVADLSHAVLTGFVEVVSVFGGFPLGLRGDGIFAGFGPGDPAIDVGLSLGACAFAMKAVEDEVNPWLKARGIEPVQARAGVDYGNITFVRSGSLDRNEVNPVGFAANFAAKCEKTAESWEVVAGAGAAAQMDDASLFVHHSKSPKRYTRNYETQEYRFYDYRWRKVLPMLGGVLRELNGRPTTDIRRAS